MSVTLLEIINRAAFELKLPEVTSVIGSSNRTVKELLYHLRDTGNDMRDRVDWPIMVRNHLLTTVEGQQAYPLPGDFKKFVADTSWDTSNQWPVVGPVTPAHWNARQHGVSQVTPRIEVRSFGAKRNQYHLHSIPDTSGDILSFEYISKNWIHPAEWVSGRAYMPGTFVSYDGNIYYTENGGTSGPTAPTGVDTENTVSDGNIAWAFYNDHYRMFLKDTDTVLLDEDTLNLGLKARWRESNGFPANKFIMDYEDNILSSLSELSGDGTIRMGGGRSEMFIGPRSVPDTGFGE